jgi:DNA polymerase (family X)
MSKGNVKVADCFDDIADLLEMDDANPYRVKAYRYAARMIRTLRQDLSVLLNQGKDLRELPSIGDDLAAKISEIVKTGRSAQLDRLRAGMPEAASDLLHLPGLGPKRVRILFHELGVQNLEQLSRAARDGRIRQLPGFGEKTERLIQASVNLCRPIQANNSG